MSFNQLGGFKCAYECANVGTFVLISNKCLLREDERHLLGLFLSSKSVTRNTESQMLTFSAPLPYIGELHVLLGLILKINSNTLCRFSFKTEPKKALFLNLQKCHEVFTCSNTLTKSPALGPVLFCLIRPLNVEKCLTHWPSTTQIRKWVKTISQRASTALFSAGDSFRHVS